MFNALVASGEVSCLIFLDVDGVLNKLHVPEESLMLDDDVIIDTSHPAHPAIFKPCVDCFKELIHALGTGVKVVVSSSWRLDSLLIAFLTKIVDFLSGEPLLEGRIVGTTRRTVTGSRSSDITDWISAHVDENASFVWLAIDDNEMNLRHIDEVHKVLTKGSVGLTQCDVLAALEKIERQKQSL
jgi:hypothetical protein